GGGDYRFQAKGLNPAERYKVMLGNSGGSFVKDGYTLASVGIPVRIDAALKSELLLFERME
ncbi:MAG: hypothetical protein J7639_24490, partial [Paenibacillaceae bacterium]|nr:hypothetical protein [Paenibacillaceae bacterium]